MLIVMVCIYIINWLLVTFFYCAFSTLKGNSTFKMTFLKKRCFKLYAWLIGTHGIFLYAVALSLLCNVRQFSFGLVAALT